MKYKGECKNMMALVQHGGVDDICEYVLGLCKEMNYFPTEEDYKKVITDCF